MIDFFGKALLEYDSKSLIISHDRYFINKIATKIFEIKDQKINEYIGNYDDYKYLSSNIKIN